MRHRERKKNDTREINCATWRDETQKHWYLRSSNRWFSWVRVCWGAFQGEKVYYRIYRFRGNGSHHVKGSRTLDRRTLFCAGWETVRRKHRHIIPHGRGRCACRRRICKRQTATGRLYRFWRKNRKRCLGWKVCGNRRGKERFSFCRGRSDQSDLDRQTGVIQSSIIYTGRKIFRKEHCREDQRCACKDGRGRCRCPHSYEPLRYCMAFEYPWRWYPERSGSIVLSCSDQGSVYLVFTGRGRRWCHPRLSEWESYRDKTIRWYLHLCSGHSGECCGSDE